MKVVTSTKSFTLASHNDDDDVDNDNEPENSHDDCNEIECRSEYYAEGDSDEEEETLVAVE